jgi:hypothetical protein
VDSATLPGYAGAANDIPHGVADNRISAPRSATGTFALAYFGALYPDKADRITQIWDLMAHEFQDAEGTS